jgi:hypothetical protein
MAIVEIVNIVRSQGEAGEDHLFDDIVVVGLEYWVEVVHSQGGHK